MSEIWLEVGSRNVVTVSLEPNNIFGRDIAGQPALYLPLKWQLLPIGQKADVSYTFVRLTGRLSNQPLGDFGAFDVGPLAEVPNSAPFFRQQQVLVIFDHHRIKRFEDARAGNDAYFQIWFSCLVWQPTEQRFAVVQSSGNFEVKIPRSHWADNVISAWNLSRIRIIEIAFPKSAVGDNFLEAYTKIEAAQRLFTSGHWKQTLGELYSAFEGLARSFGFVRPDQQFFAELLSSLHSAKKEKLKLTLDRFCDLLHLGRHEPKEEAQAFAISPGKPGLP